ncbi:MAG: hypothetical protein EB078_11005 [Proteobacteria bacterium]|nr:hypothetical protein [Pseudomonadota bacterium]NDC23265.1 hypothetical protein [Pseudomonadota bacterium]NDD05426.1 hypothetical protein [Pseudomonadota bacterium]NDG26155.1 hypothetical protein [Pseudomonadota bacterium]
MRYCLVVLALISSLSWASSTSIELKNFSIGSVRVTPANWGTSVFPDLAWTPLADFGSFAVRLGLGASSPKSSAGNHFLTTYYQAAFMIPVVSIFGVEISGGWRSFHVDDIGTHPEWGGGFLVRPGEVLDRVYICMSQYLIPNNPTSIFRVGLAISF